MEITAKQKERRDAYEKDCKRGGGLMAFRAITVENNDGNVHARDFGAYQAHTFGTGCYILEGCQATVVDANTIRVSEGEMLIEGRHVRVVGQEDLEIRSGATGRNRNDLIVVRASQDIAGVEDLTLVVLPGTPVDGAATDPSHVTGSILAGDVASEYPVFRVQVSGLTVGTPVELIPRTKPYVGHKHTAADVGALPKSGGEVAGAIYGKAPESNWSTGRDRALFRNTIGDEKYRPIISTKTKGGSWEIGAYENGVLYFSYITDATYAGANNIPAAQFSFDPARKSIKSSDVLNVEALNGIKIETTYNSAEVISHLNSFFGSLNHINAGDTPRRCGFFTEDDGTVTIDSGGIYLKDVRRGLNALLSDFPVASGKSGNWNFIKYASGLAICVASYTAEYDAPRTWGSMYYNGWPKCGHAYPFAFVGVPTAHIDIESVGGSMWFAKVNNGTASNAPQGYIISGVSQGQIAVRLNLFTVGRWK